MTDRSSDESTIAIERRPPESVFALLSDEHRVAIVRALGETPTAPVPFAELRRRVGIEDSGQFNYHLQRLRGSFVRRTEAGYELTYAGRQIVGAIHAGTYTTNAIIEPITVAAACPVCGGTVQATYADETAVVSCTDCDRWRNEFPFPPGGLDQFDREELVVAFDRWMQQMFRGMDAGFCYTCAGRVEGRLVVDDDANDPTTVEPVHVEHDCARCGAHSQASAALLATFHPAVQGFLYEHGVDLSSRPSWRLHEVMFPDVILEAASPPQATVRFLGDDGTLAVTMDADTTISAVKRRSE